MLARALPSILPPLTREEALETTAVHSVAGRLPAGTGVLEGRPILAHIQQACDDGDQDEASGTDRDIQEAEHDG